MAHRYQFDRNPVAAAESIVGGGSRKYRFTVLESGLIRYEWAEDHVFEDRASTFAINRQQPVPKYRVVEKADSLEIITHRIHLEYDKRPFSPSGFSARILGNWARNGAVWRFGEDCHDLGGTYRTLDGIDGRVDMGHGVVSRQGYATIDDSKSMLFDDVGWIATRRPGEDRIDGYLFGYGHDHCDAIKAFYALSGKQPLLPRWALGNWWSRYYAYSADEYLELMEQFRLERIPLTVGVLDMDWHLVDDPRVIGSGWTGYTWNDKLFPDPEGFLAELHKRNLKVTLNDHPADGVRSFEDLYQVMAKALNHDTSNNDPIQFDITNRAFSDAFFDVLHRHLEKQGVDFWWIDWQQGPYSKTPGVDPLWPLNHYHYLDNKIGGKRPMTFSRYAGPGSHRYPVGFSGDTIASWASLDFQPEFTATASNIGYGWWSHDIGGHCFGRRDEELATRWVQYGVFSPIFRLHSTDNPFLLKQPWTFGVEAQGIMTEFLRFRHRLLPYLFSMNVRAASEGEPIVRPMYWDFPSNDAAYNHKNQFFFGSELVVLPITTPMHADSRLGRTRGYIPPGRHVDIFTGAVYDGDREMWLHRPLSKYPVLAREGAIIPLDAAEAPENGARNPDGFEILLVAGADGSFDIAEDDDMGTDLADTQLSHTVVTYTQFTGTIDIQHQGAYLVAVPQTRDWKLKLLAFDAPEKGLKASVNGKPHTVKIAKDFRSGSTIVSLGAVPFDAKIKVELGANPQLRPTEIVKHTLPVLYNAYIDNELKRDVWRILSEDMSLGVMASELVSKDIDPVVLDALMEYLVADKRSWASPASQEMNRSMAKEQFSLAQHCHVMQ